MGIAKEPSSKPLAEVNRLHVTLHSERNLMPPIQPTMAAIRAAQALLAQHLTVSRLVRASSLGGDTDATVFLKLDTELPTGSFKIRGALYALSVRLEKGGVDEVVASSTGNHGAAVAFAARVLGVKATIFLPANPNPVKRKRIADQGATLVERGPDLAAAFEHAAAYAADRGAFLLNDATDPDLPAGPATIACEILDQLPTVRTIIVPMGDTALIRGIAAAVHHLSPHTAVIGVQAERAPSYYLSWRKGQVVGTETCDTIADGLATRTPVEENVTAIRALLTDVRLVSEDAMLQAMRRLLIDEHVVSEPAGAASTAAWLQSPEGVNGDVVLLVSGGNAPVDILIRALQA
jgi:threonine dehydratase